MADSFWQVIEPLLPRHPESAQGGRSRADRRKTMDGIFYVLLTGVPWKALPLELAKRRRVDEQVAARRGKTPKKRPIAVSSYRNQP